MPVYSGICLHVYMPLLRYWNIVNFKF
jgi:hypothetical protein